MRSEKTGKQIDREPSAAQIVTVDSEKAGCGSSYILERDSFMNYNKARNFIYKNARPLDIARWKYLFEGGSKEAVMTALAVYQNEDGGFGHALEPDCWNPESSPVQTWVAVEIIKEIELEEKEHPVIQGILKYLSSGKDFNGHTWANTIASNNDSPHAPWWDYAPDAEISYNPTASLIPFILKFADIESKLYSLALELTKEAYGYFKQNYPLESAHTVSCFVELYDYLTKNAAHTNKNPDHITIDLAEFRTLLQKQIQSLITYDTHTWATEYVCKPSLFISSKTSDFYAENQEICEYECEFIADSQEPDGTWAITWSWTDYPEEWSISKNWWKSDWIIKNLRYIKTFRGLDSTDNH